MDEMWAEIEALQQQLAAAQEEDTSQRLSDRNCIEIIMKLKEMNLVELIHSTNGKFYLTPSKLRSEVYDALVNAGGRSTIGDLADEVGVNYNHVEEALAAIKEEKKLIFFLGNFITQEYLDFIAGEIYAMTNVTGFVSISKVSQEFDLSGEFLIEHVPKRCAAMINNQKTGFYTEAYIQRTSVSVRGYLSSAEKPLHMKHYYAKYKFADETIVDKVVDDMIKSSRLKGKFLNRGPIACFFPTVYLEEQTKTIKMKIESYGYIKTDELKHAIDTTNEKEAKRWMKENFPEFVQTDSHFMSHGFIERTKTELEQNVQQIHLVDLFSIFPDALSEKDVEYIMRSASASSAIINDAKLFGASWLMDDVALEECAALFHPVVDERAEKAASKKIVTIITEDDFVKVDKKSPSVKAEVIVAAGKEKGGAGGGRGAREAKTKGKNKKQKKKEAQEQSQKKETGGGALTEDEIKDVLQQNEKYEIMEEDALQDLIDVIAPKLAERYQTQATNIFTSKQQAQNDAKSARKMTRKEQEQYITNCFCKLHLFHQGLENLFGDPEQDTDAFIPQLRKYLFKTVGMDLVNAVFALSSDSQETTLTAAMRQKILKGVEENDRVDMTAYDALKALNDCKDVVEILDKAKDACDYGAQMMIKADRKRITAVKDAHMEELRKALAEATDLATTLHLAVSLMYGQAAFYLIHFSGKFVPRIAAQMAPFINPHREEKIATINASQDAVVKLLRKEGEVDTAPLIEKLKSFDYTSDPDQGVGCLPGQKPECS